MRIINALLSASVLLVFLFPQALAAPPGAHLNIEEVVVTVDAPKTTLKIIGSDFDFGSPLEVTLAGVPVPAVDIISATSTEIIATVLTAFFPAGDYLLTVSTGNGQSQNDEYDLTIGAVGLQGPKGDTGDQGEKGDTGMKGDTGDTGMKGDTGDTGMKGDTGATGATGMTGMTGAEGPQGDPGADGIDGSSCSAIQGEGSATVECTDGTSATVFDGEDGSTGPSGTSNRTLVIGPRRRGVTGSALSVVFCPAGQLVSGCMGVCKADVSASALAECTHLPVSSATAGDLGGCSTEARCLHVNSASVRPCIAQAYAACADP